MSSKYLIIAAVLLLSSCVTQKKVNRWLDDHRTEAAGYCADTFPPDTITKTVVENIDSAGYYDAYMNMAYLADSLFYKLDSLTYNATPDKPYKPNIDSLRKIVDKEIRKRLKPCIDTVIHITHTVVDKARETQLRGIIDQKDQVIARMQNDNQDLRDNIKAKRKWVWMFWGLVVLIGGYTVLKIKRMLPI